jgi:hypothetical protein
VRRQQHDHFVQDFLNNAPPGFKPSCFLVFIRAFHQHGDKYSAPWIIGLFMSINLALDLSAFSSANLILLRKMTENGKLITPQFNTVEESPVNNTTSRMAPF